MCGFGLVAEVVSRCECCKQVIVITATPLFINTSKMFTGSVCLQAADEACCGLGTSEWQSQTPSLTVSAMAGP